MKLSVIIPAHNESQNILNALEKISSFLNKKRYDYEIIVSEDGSTDNTFQLSKDYAKHNRRVKALHSRKRLGKGGGILHGFKKARGDIIAFIDADLSSGPTELEKVVKAVEQGNDVAIASRHMKQSKIIRDRPFLRRIAAKGMNFLVNSMFGFSISDTQCGLKAFSRKAWEKILPQMTKSGFEFDVELLLRAKNLGMKIKEVPIVWTHQQKTSKISGLPFGVTKQIGTGIFDLWLKNYFNRFDLFFFLFLAFFIAIAIPFLGTYIDPDEGTHLTIAAFYYNLFRDLISHPTISFTKIYNYSISYLVHYPKLSLYYPPAFHSIVATFSYLFGLSAFTGAATGLLFGILTILAVYYFGRKFLDKKTGIVAAILFTLIPQVFYLSIKAMLDLTYIFFFFLSLAFYLFALKSGKTRHFIYVGIILAIGFFFKQNIILLAPVVLIYTFFISKKSLKQVLISFVLSAIIVAPYIFAVYKLGLVSIMLKSSLGFGSSAVQTRPQFNTLAGWLFYPKQLGEIYFSYPIFIVAFGTLLYYAWKKEKYWKLFLIWFFVLLLFLVFIPNKEGRYILPAVPALVFPLAFYISKLPKIFFVPTFLVVVALLLYTSYLVLFPSFYYNTNYSELASNVLQKKGNVLLAADSNSLYASTFIFEMMRLDASKENSVFRPCVLDVKDIDSLLKENGIRYAIVPDNSLIQTSNTSAVTNDKSFQPIKVIKSQNTTLTIYENINYVPQKENCNYICVTNQWICSNFTNSINALR